MNSLILESLEDTRKLGTCIARELRTGDTILLSGDLGAGKTTLTRFIAQGLGIDEREVTSPTFSIIHEYPGGRLPVIHADLYRLGKNADILDTGIEEYLAGDFILIIEWADFLSEPLADEFLAIHLAIQDNARTALLEGSSSWLKRIRKIERCFPKEDLK